MLLIRRAAALAALVLAACGNPPSASLKPIDAGTLVIMGTTDVHGWLLPYDYYTGESVPNGLARLAPIVDSVRAAHPGRSILIDTGDLLQGNPLTFVHSRPGTAAENPVISAMNLLGYDASSIGNHEFNYGIEHLEMAIARADFPFVTANVFVDGTREHAFTPYTIVERAIGGATVRIGITGVTPPGVLIWDRDHVTGRLDFAPIVASVEATVREMKAAGADVIVVAAHSGLEGSSYDTIATGVPAENASAAIARAIPEVDLILVGHSHGEIADTTIGGTLLIQPKNWAASLAVAEMELVREGDAVRVVSARGQTIRPAADALDPRFPALLADADRRTREYVGRVIGESPIEWSAHRARVEDSAIMDLINEVQLSATGADISSTAAFTLASRIPAGPVTVADIAGLYIYDNTLKAIRISGEQLRAYLEKSAEYYLPCPDGACDRVVNPDVAGYNFDVVAGVDYTLDISKPVGSRVIRLERDGESVQPSDSLVLALNNYRASGAGGYTMLVGAPVVYDRGEGIRELVIREIERRGTLDPEDFHERNWEIVPAALAERAAREQVPPPTASERAPGRGTSSSAGRLRVLATNDFHGALLPDRPGFAGGREVGGAAVIAAYFNQARAEFDGPTVVIDAGDVMQGTTISNLTEGRATVAFYNAIGYTAAALGNHEFDWGVETLRERVHDAEFAWLGANIFVRGTDTLPSWVEPTTLVTVRACEDERPRCAPVNVGVIGLATEQTPDLVKPSHIASLSFGSEAAAIDRWVPRLREAGADFVIVTAHSGAYCDRDDPSRGCEGEIVDVARAITHRPDLIVSGHTHSRVNTVVNGIPIVQANSSGTRFSIVDLERRGDSRVAIVRDQPTTYADRVTPDAATARLVATFEEEVGPRVNEIITMIDRPLTREGREFPLGNLIADAQRAAVDAEIALMNNGGIRTDLLSGPVRYGDVFRLQPFANTLVRMTLTGEQLFAALEQGLTRDGLPDTHISGITVHLAPGAPAGRRIREVRLEDGSTVRPGDRYTVVVNDFMAEGGSGYTVLTQGTDVERTGIVDLDALLDYLRAMGAPTRVPEVGRWRIADRQPSS